MILYKATDYNNFTSGGMLWGENVTHKIKSKKKCELCTNTAIHAYIHPAQYYLCNGLHLSYSNLWLAEGKVVVSDATKVGVKKLTTIRRLAYNFEYSRLFNSFYFNRYERLGFLCYRELDFFLNLVKEFEEITGMKYG